MNIFTRMAASVQARYIIPYQQSHFSRTKYGKQLASYKRKFAGKRCFLIGNGPSLRAEDMTRLHEAGEITFAFNRIYNIFDQTPWRPNFYISQDEKMLAGCADAVCGLKADAKFIPIQLNGGTTSPLTTRNTSISSVSRWMIHNSSCFQTISRAVSIILPPACTRRHRSRPIWGLRRST